MVGKATSIYPVRIHEGIRWANRRGRSTGRRCKWYGEHKEEEGEELSSFDKGKRLYCKMVHQEIHILWGWRFGEIGIITSVR